MKKITLLIVLGIIIFSFALVKADLITPGYSPISITNKITNINDFPDYVFITWGMPMCRVQQVGRDGIIPGDYKFCQLSVYAIKKTEFDSSILTNVDNEPVDYFRSIDSKKVITNINHYEERVDSDPVREVIYSYKIELGKVQTEPNKADVKRDFKIYFYIGVPIIALIGLIIYLKKRKK